MANRKPIPLPTREYFLTDNLDQAVWKSLPHSKQKFLQKTLETKKNITTGKYLKSEKLRSDWLQNKKKVQSPSKTTDSSKDHNSTTQSSNISIEFEGKFPHNRIDDQVYFKFCQQPVYTNPIENHPNEEDQFAFSSNISKAVENEAIHEKVSKYVLHDHCHLPLNITSSSSEDELFLEEQGKSGNDNIAGILRDKNLNGQELLDLTELKVINWRLTSNQRKDLFEFINDLAVNPSNPLRKYISANVSKSDSNVTKSSPTKLVNHELIQNTQSNPSAFGNPPEIVISEKKANFVQELNFLLSSPKFIKDDENITSRYEHRTLSLSRNNQFHLKDSMDVLHPNGKPLQNVLKTSPKPNRKPFLPRTGLAKSLSDLVNERNEAVCTPPVPFKQKIVRKISDHEDELNKKKETENFSQPMLRVIDDAESFSSATNLLRSFQNVPNVPPEGNRKPIPLPTRGIVQPLVQVSDQAVCEPIPSSNRRFIEQVSENTNNIEPDSTGKHMKKKKFSLPAFYQSCYPRSCSESSCPQSPGIVDNVSPEVNRKPIPLPTKGSAQPLVQTTCALSPTSQQKFNEEPNGNKPSIEQDATGKYQESDKLHKKEETSPSKFVNLKEEDESTKYSTFYIPLEGNTSQGTAVWKPHDVDEYGYLKMLPIPVDKMPLPSLPKEHKTEKKLETRNEFLLDLSKAVKEKATQIKVTEFIVQDHSHLSLIKTPPSSDDELFDEEQENVYTNKTGSINGSTSCNKVAFQPLPRPPARMLTPEIFDEDIFFITDVKHDAAQYNKDNLTNEQYYMQIDRKETKKLLRHQENGSFLFRPCREFFLVLTIKHCGKLYNFGIDLADDGKIYLNGKSGSALGGFSNLPDFVNYFCCEPITFIDDETMIEIYMSPFLGPDSFSVKQ